jgi:Mn2+/Fe2+ NRAMP family transporter
VAGQVCFSCERSVRILKWLTLALFSYFAVVMVVKVPFEQAVVESPQPWRYCPQGVPVVDCSSMVVAVLGTTISPYLFVWQALQEVEDKHRRPDAAELRGDRADAVEHRLRIKQDTGVGRLFSNAIAVCIVIATGLLAVPVLGGSAAHAVSEVFGWQSGRSHDIHEARGFYVISIAAGGIGSKSVRPPLPCVGGCGSRH